jgi:hypothetical protein
VKIASIVEGDGEVKALPVLLRRLAGWRPPDPYPQPLRPIKVSRDRFLNREQEFSRHLQLAAKKCEGDGWILILLDADDDCPAELGPTTLERARKCVPHRPVSVVLANREYEAWFIATAASLDGCRGFVYEPTDTIDAEVPRNAKGWIKARIQGQSYGEVMDQPAFSARMDLQVAYENSRSFRKLCAEWDKQCLSG